MSSRPSRGAARLAAILDALPDGLLLVNCNGTVVNANTVALEMLEAPGTGLVGRGVLDLLPSFDSRLIPGSMRRPESEDDQGRTKPTRMAARRTDGTEFPVEVTSANLEDGRDAYASYGSGGGPGSYSGDELLMLVVRDLSGTVDTEAELARSQRQTEMILRAAAEGVVGTDTDGRVVLVNPAAAQILGYRASDLGGKELHPLVLHSREDGEPFPYEGSPLADTLKSGRKHRVRGQVIWTKSGAKVPVDLTTAPVRDGDLLVGAVMTFTDRRPYEEQAAKHAEVLERETKRYDALAARHQQLLSVLGGSLRGPIDELRQELAALAADDAGQLWPEANQVLHHLAAGYSRITTLVDNVLGYQRLDAGGEELKKTTVLVDSVVGAGVDGAVELIGPGRAQFAVHTPPIEAEVDAPRLSTALAHLIADVAGVDATGKAPIAAGGYMDSTVVVAAAVRGEVVRIEVRGPYAGGDPVHGPIVRGIVRAHGGVLQTVDVPGMSGSAYVLEVPLGAGRGPSRRPWPRSPTRRCCPRSRTAAAAGVAAGPPWTRSWRARSPRRSPRPGAAGRVPSPVRAPVPVPGRATAARTVTEPGFRPSRTPVTAKAAELRGAGAQSREAGAAPTLPLSAAPRPVPGGAAAGQAPPNRPPGRGLGRRLGRGLGRPWGVPPRGPWSRVRRAPASPPAWAGPRWARRCRRRACRPRPPAAVPAARCPRRAAATTRLPPPLPATAWSSRPGDGPGAPSVPPRPARPREAPRRVRRAARCGRRSRCRPPTPTAPRTRDSTSVRTQVHTRVRRQARTQARTQAGPWMRSTVAGRGPWVRNP